MTEVLRVGWGLGPPMRPVAVLAQGPSVGPMRARLRSGPLAGLSGVGNAELVVVIGEAALLPWVEGALYLGRPAGAVGVLWPVLLWPDQPVDLVAERIVAGWSGRELPVAYLPDPGRVIPLGAARPISVAWLEGAR